MKTYYSKLKLINWALSLKIMNKMLKTLEEGKYWLHYLNNKQII